MIDEIAGISPNNTIKAVCNEFVRKYGKHNAGLFVYGDKTADKSDTKLESGYNFYRLVMDYLKDFRPQLRLLSTNPSVAMRGMWINTVLEKELNGVKFIIGDNCKHTINDFVNLKEASDGTKSKEMATDPNTKVRYQKVGHFTDLFDYIACTAFANEYTSFQTGSRKLGITLGNNVSRNVY